MRGAFVVQLGPETRPTEGQFEGWVEEVDSGPELRFRSGEELLEFMAKRHELTVARTKKLPPSSRTEQVPCDKRRSPQARESTWPPYCVYFLQPLTRGTSSPA